MNYHGFRNNQVHLQKFFFNGTYVQTKIRDIAKFGINKVLL
jgi:sRNA-binding regulator protein Hfq